MVQNMAACKFDPAVLACKEGRNSSRLPGAKIEVITRIFSGTKNSKGEVIYSAWPYDPGIANACWRAWRLGTPKASPPNARNVTLISGSIAYVFMSPAEKPANLLNWEMKFRFRPGYVEGV